MRKGLEVSFPPTEIPFEKDIQNTNEEEMNNPKSLLINRRLRFLAGIFFLSCFLPDTAHATWYVCVPTEIYQWGLGKVGFEKIKIKDVNNWVMRVEDEDKFINSRKNATFLGKLTDRTDLVAITISSPEQAGDPGEIRIRKQKDGSLIFRSTNYMYVMTGTCTISSWDEYYKPVKQPARK